MRRLLSCFSIFLILIVFGCKKEEDCGGLECKNGATCVNNSCDCPPHYAGADCGQQITPTQISIRKIQVSQWPQQTPDGENWDEGWCIGPLPDLLVEVEYGNKQRQKTSYYPESKPDTTYTFTDSLSLITSDINTELILTLYDNDTGFCSPSDSLGTVKTQLYTPTNDFPDKLELSDKKATIKTTVFLEYRF